MKSLALAALTLSLALLPLGAAVPSVPAPQIDATHTVQMAFVAGTAPVFNPPVLRIAVGDTVRFASLDTLHSATAGITDETEALESGPLDQFDTGPVPAGSSASVTFTQPGVYAYYCKVGLHRHLGMRGVLVVA